MNYVSIPLATARRLTAYCHASSHITLRDGFLMATDKFTLERVPVALEGMGVLPLEPFEVIKGVRSGVLELAVCDGVLHTRCGGKTSSGKFRKDAEPLNNLELSDVLGVLEFAELHNLRTLNLHARALNGLIEVSQNRAEIESDLGSTLATIEIKTPCRIRLNSNHLEMLIRNGGKALLHRALNNGVTVLACGHTLSGVMKGSEPIPA